LRYMDRTFSSSDRRDVAVEAVRVAVAAISILREGICNQRAKSGTAPFFRVNPAMEKT
jgi:hypothetical protein